MHRIFSNILGNNNRNSPTQPTFVLPTPQYQQSSSENNNAVDSGRPGCEEPSSAEGRDCVPRALRLSDFRGDVENALVSLHEMEPAERGTSWLINDIGEALREAGRKEEAKALFTEALAARRANLGESHAGTLTSLNNLGLLLRELGELEPARALLSEAVARRRASQGDAHPETLTSINNLGSLLKAMGDLKAARPLYEEALATRRDALGNEHPDTLTSMNNLASLYRAQKEFTDAEALYYEAAATAQRVLGSDHPHTRIFHANLKGVRGQIKPSGSIFTEPTSGNTTNRKAVVKLGIRGMRRSAGPRDAPVSLD